MERSQTYSGIVTLVCNCFEQIQVKTVEVQIPVISQNALVMNESTKKFHNGRRLFINADSTDLFNTLSYERFHSHHQLIDQIGAAQVTFNTFAFKC
jgi:hypothetical protein